MKNIIAKVVGLSAYVAADLGVMAALGAAFSKLWQKFELTEDYVINHPKLAIARLVLRMFVTVATICLICVAPVMYVTEIILTWCDNMFGDDQEDLQIHDDFLD